MSYPLCVPRPTYLPQLLSSNLPFLRHASIFFANAIVDAQDPETAALACARVLHGVATEALPRRAWQVQIPYFPCLLMAFLSYYAGFYVFGG
jgi:hypothetical protein